MQSTILYFTWLDLTWFGLAWLDLTWLDLTLLDFTYLTLLYFVGQTADKILSEASSTKTQAQELEEESNTLANDVRDAENRVTLLESQADDDTVLLEEVGPLS